MREKAVLFGKKKSLVGVVTEPRSVASSTKLPAIIILNAGLLHRVGPNRLHVKIARKMADAGFTTLRFDFSGNGDSTVRNDNIPFGQSAIDEIQDAINYLSFTKRIEKFILVGICSGADVAIKATCCNNHVVGTVGINGFYLGGDISREMKVHVVSSIQNRYYQKHLFNYKSWWRLVTGKSDLSGIISFLATRMKDLLSKRRQPSPPTHYSKTAKFLPRSNANIFLVYSEGSAALDTFQLAHKNSINTLTSSGKLSIKVIKHSDHVFTLLESQNILMDLISKWATNTERNWYSG